MIKQLTFVILILSTIACSSAQKIDINKIKQKVTNTTGKTNVAPTNEEIIKGLKEALSVGSNNASGLASKLDGYYKNPRLFIPFPPEAQNMEKKLRDLGYGKKVDEFIMTMNRAAENAAKESAKIFLDAITKMSISDGLGILNGGDNAATNYLKTNTNSALIVKFKPIVQNALNTVSATKYWTDLVTIYNKIPLVTKVNPDLAGYTTDKAITGLFILVADEEGKIRKDPAARVSDILKKVFGYKKP